MVDDDDARNGADQLRWRCLCLCRQISAVAPIISLLRQFPGGLCPETQTWFINECADEPLTRHFPRNIDYERKLLRAVVLAVESDGHELSEELMTAFSNRLNNTSNSSSCQWSYKLYAYSGNSSDNVPELGPDDNKSLINGIKKIEQAILQKATEVVAEETTKTPHHTIAASTEGDAHRGLLALHVSNDMLAGETGCWDWEAGFFLSEFIFNHPSLFTGKNILELGSGCGMTGVALARVSAASVVCTDGDKEALDNCLDNLRINGLQITETLETPPETETTTAGAVNGLQVEKRPSIAVQRLRWEDGASSISQHSIDIIVGADLTYDPVNIPPLVRVLKESFLLSLENKPKGNHTNQGNKGIAVAYIATTRRSEATFQKFLDALDRETELQVEDISKEATTTTEMISSGDGVCFCHVTSLEEARERIVLHRITAK